MGIQRGKLNSIVIDSNVNYHAAQMKAHPKCILMKNAGSLYFSSRTFILSFWSEQEAM